MKTKMKLVSPYHFYASSIAEWRTGTDLTKLIKAMDAGGFNFAVFFIPLPEESEYKIENYQPVVEGATLIAEYKRELDDES